MKNILVAGVGNWVDSEFGPVVDSTVVYLDKIALPHVNVVHDLNSYPYPFKDVEFDEIWAEHVLEHLDDLDKTMEELYRIAKPGGVIRVLVPAWTAWQAYADPSHKRFFTRESFDFWDDTTHLGKERGYYLSQKIKIKVEKKEIRFRGILAPVCNYVFNKIYKLYRKNLSWIFPASDICFELRVVKN